VDSWSFAASRSDPEKRTVEEGNGVGVGSGIYNGVLSWIMPQSRSDRDHMDSDGGQSNEVETRWEVDSFFAIKAHGAHVLT
jgi:hypothetical protein